jgi:hypothetical protein
MKPAERTMMFGNLANTLAGPKVWWATRTPKQLCQIVLDLAEPGDTWHRRTVKVLAACARLHLDRAPLDWSKRAAAAAAIAAAEAWVEGKWEGRRDLQISIALFEDDEELKPLEERKARDAAVCAFGRCEVHTAGCFEEGNRVEWPNISIEGYRPWIELPEEGELFRNEFSLEEVLDRIKEASSPH